MAKRKLGPLIKRLYIEEGLGDTDIAIRLKCDRGSVSYHKKKDKDAGIDWDELRANREYNRMTSTDNFEEDKKEFLTTLFNAFKKEKQNIEKIKDPTERLQRWNQFANNYHKFLKPSANDCKGVADKASRSILNIIIDFAVEYERNDLVEFLADHFEEITVKAVENVKKMK